MNAQPEAALQRCLAPRDERHLANLTQPEITRALRRIVVVLCRAPIEAGTGGRAAERPPSFSPA